jgi:hypothetical protein
MLSEHELRDVSFQRSQLRCRRSAQDALGAMGLRDTSVSDGDKGGAGRRRVTIPFTHIAIVQVVAPNARDRPKAVVGAPNKQTLRRR